MKSTRKARVTARRTLRRPQDASLAEDARPIEDASLAEDARSIEDSGAAEGAQIIEAPEPCGACPIGGVCLPEADLPRCDCPDGEASIDGACPRPTLTPALCADVDPMRHVGLEHHASDAFDVFYLPGTSAERDLEQIVALREEALDKISVALGVEETRRIELDLSPNRLAAVAHNVGAGIASPSGAWLGILYLDDPDSYEQTRYGHELTHALSWHLDPEWEEHHLKIVDEGIAEVFDQSGRDLHMAFAQDLRVAGERVEDALRFDEDDVSGYDYPKAGSLMRLLLDLDDRPEALHAFYQACRMRWDWNDPLTPSGEPLTPSTLERVIDEALQAHYGLTLEALRGRWLEALQPRLEAPPPRVSPEDQAEIRRLVAARDWAFNMADVDVFRATMEGFTCDVVSDADREASTHQGLQEPTLARSRILEIVDTGVINYPSASVNISMRYGDQTIEFWDEVERYPEGWKFN